MNEELLRQARVLAAQPYSTEVTPDVLEEGRKVYVAYNPELPGCMAQGETLDEAIANLDAARVDYIYFLLVDDLPVPRPVSELTAGTGTVSRDAGVSSRVTVTITGAATYVVRHGPAEPSSERSEEGTRYYPTSVTMEVDQNSLAGIH